MKQFRPKKKKKLVTVARRKGLSDRMGGTVDYRMTTIGALLGRSLDDRGGDLFLTLDPAFQGLPDTAHGGAGPPPLRPPPGRPPAVPAPRAARRAARARAHPRGGRARLRAARPRRVRPRRRPRRGDGSGRRRP